jgi:hypothetical protein
MFKRKSVSMDSFDIVIPVQDKEVSLTLQPEEEGAYKVIYHGMLVGEIATEDNGASWHKLSIAEVTPGIYPMYEHDAAKDTPRIVLDEATLQKIGEAIAQQEN